MPNWNKCPKCGADNDPKQKMCWLCWENFGEVPSRPTSSSPAPSSSTPPPLSSYYRQQVDGSASSNLGTQAMIIGGFILLCVGILAFSPGIGAVFALFSVPVIMALMKASSSTQKGVLVGIAGFVAFVIAAMGIAMAVGVIAIFAMCFGMKGFHMY